MTKRKKITFWSVGIILAIVLIFVFFNRGKNKVEYETTAAQKKDLFQTVSVTGELVSEDELGLNFEIGGRIKSVDVFESKKVAKGDVVGMIEDEILSQEYNQARAALDKALADAGANDDIVRESEQRKDNAEDFLDETEDLEDQKIDAAEQAYDDAKDYYDDALIYYNQIVSDSGASSAAAKNAKLTLDSAQSSKNAAEEAVETAKKARDLAMVSAENTLKSAKESLETAESDFAESSRDSVVESARSTYNIALKNLEKAVLKAPANGTITKVNYKSGEVLGSAAFDLSASASTAFATMITTDFIIEANVPESDILKIKNGQNATITFDAFDESEKFQASVVEIDPASTVIQDVVYYRVKVLLDNIDQRLKSGMSADIDIHTAEKRNVIVAPRRVIKEDGDKKTIDLLIGEDEVKTVEVKTGLRGDDGEIEIMSGLKEGDEVITLVKNGNKK